MVQMIYGNRSRTIHKSVPPAFLLLYLYSIHHPPEQRDHDDVTVDVTEILKAAGNEHAPENYADGGNLLHHCIT